MSFIDAQGDTQFSQSNLALPVILDSGTTASYLPDEFIDPILSGVGAINDPGYGTIVPCRLASSLANFTFGFGGLGGPTITVAFGQYLFPIFNQQGVQPEFTDGAGTVCAFNLLSSGTGPLILGDNFLRSAYVVYDLANNQIALANTNFNSTTSNVVEISGSSIPGASFTATATAAQTFSGIPLGTEAITRTGITQETVAHGTPTFELGVAASATGNGGAAGGVGSPKIEVSALITGLVLLVSLAFGGSLVHML